VIYVCACVCAQNNLSKPLLMEDIDSSSGLLIPFLDVDNNVVYIAGKVSAVSLYQSIH